MRKFIFTLPLFLDHFNSGTGKKAIDFFVPVNPMLSYNNYKITGIEHSGMKDGQDHITETMTNNRKLNLEFMIGYKILGLKTK